MGLEDIEKTEMPEETMQMKETMGMGFNLADLEARNTDLMPKIRFTTDQAEAEAAKNADRSDPLHLPDAVFYVGPKDSDGESGAEDAGDAQEGTRDIPRLTRDNESGYDFSQTITKDTYATIMKLADLAKDNEPAPSLDKDIYVGPSVKELDFKIEEAKRSLERAEESLQKTIENGGSILTAQSVVETSRGIVEKLLEMQTEAARHEAAM